MARGRPKERCENSALGEMERVDGEKGNLSQEPLPTDCDLCGFESGLPLTQLNASSQRVTDGAVSYAVGTPVRSQSPLPSVATAASGTTCPTGNGGGATGTIRPSTSPRMPTSGFEDRGAHLSPCTPVRDEG